MEQKSKTVKKTDSCAPCLTRTEEKAILSLQEERMVRRWSWEA